jgi:hypothetical protein
VSDPSARVRGGWLPGVTLAFGGLLVGVIVLANTGWFRGELRWFIGTIPGGDKSVHFGLAGAMALLLNLSWRGACWRLGLLPIQQGSALVAVVCTLEELSQLFVRARAFDPIDLFYDYLGILVLGQVGAWLHLMSARRVLSGSGRGT